jgi:microcystin-dependent protein
MGVITTGQTFSSGDQVTATKLNDIGNSATFTSAADTTDDSTLTLIPSSKKLKVADAGITATQLATDSVITAKIQDGAVTAAKLDAGAVSVLMPTGSIMSFAGSSAPTGYLLCNDTPISRTTYSALFALIGTTYGSGDGSTTFNIPDLRGRVIAGQDDMGGSSANRLTGLAGGVDGDVLGGFGGLETHTLLTAEMPSHTHTYNRTGPSGGASVGGIGDGPDTGIATSTETGLNGAHNNVQPTIILNYIIKT